MLRDTSPMQYVITRATDGGKTGYADDDVDLRQPAIMLFGRDTS